MSSLNYECDLDVGQMSHDQAIKLGKSLASQLRGTEFKHKAKGSYLQMSALKPIHPYTAISDCLHELKQDGKINPREEIVANGSAIIGVKGDSQSLCKYLFLQDDKDIISILDMGHGEASPPGSIVSMKVTQDGNTSIFANVQPGFVKVNHQNEFSHVSTNASGLRGPESYRPSNNEAFERKLEFSISKPIQ
jgi:hypothetical protein